MDVLDVSTQRGLQMTMHQWSKYFESDKRESLLNVISLEISHTDLCAYVQPPDVVSGSQRQGERERETEKERKTERERQRERDRERERDRNVAS